MSNAPTSDRATVEELRRAFDESFALPRREQRAPVEALLLVRIGGHRYGLRMSELRGLHEGPKVKPFPSIAPPLLGITRLRGELMPVYSLARLLERGGDHLDHRWLVACEGSGTVIALAFNGFEGSIQVSDADLYLPERPATLPPHTCQVARLPDAPCYVVSTKSILTTLAAERSPQNQ